MKGRDFRRGPAHGRGLLGTGRGPLEAGQSRSGGRPQDCLLRLLGGHQQTTAQDAEVGIHEIRAHS